MRQINRLRKRNRSMLARWLSRPRFERLVAFSKGTPKNSQFRARSGAAPAESITPTMALPNSNSGTGHIPSIDALIDRSRALGYVMDRSLGTAIYLLVRLGKPLLIDEHVESGKTEAAKVLASLLRTELLPRPCYAG